MPGDAKRSIQRTIAGSVRGGVAGPRLSIARRNALSETTSGTARISIAPRAISIGTGRENPEGHQSRQYDAAGQRQREPEAGYSL